MNDHQTGDDHAHGRGEDHGPDQSRGAAGDAASGTDRRRFPRLARSCSIRVRPLSGVEAESASLDTVTVNISGGGLCYESPEAISVGRFVAVELEMSELESPVLALARTAFCAPKGPPYEVGLEFWWVGWGDDSAQRAISEMIKAELRQQGHG